MALASGCNAIPPLGDAKLISVELAKPADLARLSQAHERFARASFDGATVSDPRLGVLTFSDYDAYLAYEHDHPELRPSSSQAGWSWPMLHISFSTSRILLAEDDTEFSRLAQLSFCSGKLIGRGDVLWQGQVVTNGIADQIAAAAVAGPQSYEMFALYTHASDILPDDLTVMLLPPADDFCLSISSWVNWPVGPTTGTPLRISKDTVASALGPLPRRIGPKSEPAP